MKILFCCTKELNKNNKGYCTYYSDIYYHLKKKHDVDYINKKARKLSDICRKKYDLLIIGFGYTDTGGKKPNELHNLMVNNINIPVFIILNKEYDAIEKKLDWCKLMKPKAILTVHHDYKKYSEITKLPCHRIMWSIDDSLFKAYEKDYDYDLFYSGVIRKEQTDNYRRLIITELKKLKNYKLNINARYEENNYKGNILDAITYAKLLSKSKICFTSTSAGDLVNPRFFEAMATNRAMILCNKMDKIVYEDMLIDGFNCIMFDSVEDFIVKFKYYIEHEEERIKIVNQAYKYFNESQKWEHRINKITSIIKNYI